MFKKFRNKYLAVTLVALSAFAIGGSLYLWRSLSASATVAGLDQTIEQVRKHPGNWKAEKDFSGLMADLKANDIAVAGISPSAVLVTTRSGNRYFVMDYAGKISGSILAEYEKMGGQPFRLAVLSNDPAAPPRAAQIALGIGALGLVLYLLYVRFRPFGKKEKTGVTFKDVIGSDEAKKAFGDIVDYLRDPKKYAEFGARPPKGILLAGAPGGGKTHLARALAGESAANFMAITGSEFSSMFYGVGIQRVKSIFGKARRSAPCILFIDEIDGIGQRTKAERAGDAEPNRIINQILTEMDGFHPAAGIIVIGATNKPDALDEAMLREGRFDRKIHVSVPGLEDRKSLFEHYTAKLKATDSLDFDQLARVTTGLTPAAISSVINAAAFSAARQNSAMLKMSTCLRRLKRRAWAKSPPRENC
jgi:cell division protease FtsH